MNRIMSRSVLLALPAIAASVFFLITCSNPEPQTDPVKPPVGSGDSSSSIEGGPSSSSPVQELPSSSSPEEGTTSSSEQSASGSSSSEQGASSSDTDLSSSSAAGSSSSNKPSSSSKKSSSSVAVAPPVGGDKDYTEKVGSVEFDMVYIPGGTFTLGCESGCPQGTASKVEGVKVSNYFIMKTEVTQALWNAVMGKSGGSTSSSYASATWYQAFEFACKLSNLTGKNYRMMTEAEFEYAAKKYKDKLAKIGGGSGISGEEWAYNSWDVKNTDPDNHGTDPVGPTSGRHTQKTRRDANVAGESSVTARLIRSIDGTGPSIRLVVSADVPYPPKYVPSCAIQAPVLGAEPPNSYRDPRWITGSDAHWKTGSIAIGSFDLTVWEDGTAKLGSTAGQWFTSNNIAFVFVPSSSTGKPIKFAYIFLNDIEGSVISDQNLMTNGGYVGRFELEEKTISKPSVSGLKSGEELAKAQGAKFDTDYKMVDMTNMPTNQQDPRLFDEENPKANPSEAKKGWFQDNTSMAAQHHYRKDVDPDEFRFTVNQNNGRNVLAAGTWFTVNNTFLRIKHKNGYTADYLYTVTPGGTFYHNSFIGYERADFRMFEKATNGASFPKTTCGNICSEEIPKGLTPGRQANDESTFKPAPNR